MHFFKKIRIILKSIQSSLPSESKKSIIFYNYITFMFTSFHQKTIRFDLLFNT